MPTFTPPIVNDRPNFNADSTEEQKALFKFFHVLNPRYVQVFLLSDGSFVQDTPGGFAPDGSVVVNVQGNGGQIPYPWDPSNPSAPYATSIFYDLSKTPPPRVTAYISHTIWIVSVTNGIVEVTAAMAAALTAAGYGACIS